MNIEFDSNAKQIIAKATEIARDLTVHGVMSPMVVAGALQVYAPFREAALAGGVVQEEAVEALVGAVVSRKGQRAASGAYPLDWSMVERAAGYAKDSGQSDICAESLIRAALGDQEYYRPRDILVRIGWVSIVDWV